MNKKARHWFSQEIEMVKNRVLLYWIPRLTFGYYTTFYSGNPMTIREGFKHMVGVVRFIGEHPDYYNK